MSSEPRALRILIADDEPDVRLLLRLQLAAEDRIEVVGEVGDGQAAVDECRRHHPDAVVMDLLMPRMSGIEAIEVLRRELPDIGVVAYTATAGEFVRDEMERLSVRLLLKSGDVAPLVEALWAAAGRPVPRGA